MVYGRDIHVRLEEEVKEVSAQPRRRYHIYARWIKMKDDGNSYNQEEKYALYECAKNSSAENADI